MKTLRLRTAPDWDWGGLSVELPIRLPMRPDVCVCMPGKKCAACRALEAPPPKPLPAVLERYKFPVWTSEKRRAALRELRTAERQAAGRGDKHAARMLRKRIARHQQRLEEAGG